MRIKEATAINLSYDQIDAIIIHELKTTYERQLKEIERYNSKLVLKDFEITDRASCKEIRDAARVMIEYFLPADDAYAYFKSLEEKHNDLS
jgi:hypothetical protein